MRNSFKTTINVTRLEIVDLMMACTHAKFSANDGGKKWKRLHDKLKEQLDALDAQLDEIENMYK